jgi:nucleoid DNA-binding protein
VSAEPLGGIVLPLPPRRPARTLLSLPGYRFEGRRGRRHREMLAKHAPEELPPDPVVVANRKERERATRRASRDLLERLVAQAGRHGHLSPAQSAQVLAAFFTDAAWALQQGRCVVIPGFGALVARPSQPRPGRRQRLYTAFSAARNLAVSMSEWGRFDEESYRQWSVFRKNHRPSGRRWREIARTPTGQITRAWAAVGRVAKRRWTPSTG